ncbi:hypothetical protein VIN01S_15800 [Vibrio inusitatus NBRC 102082]|uniref:HTH luxR-type domain-containing protein n=1 Tax=Vibrio inusitatus NBRC 102082 TaxID=1219070 RepID=A0A4Y3HUM0_9VIBR|nr:LuxR C-terminal-related transcriptional regulator [Vibrio inusitatus]GEA50776.1 hypothetical protein VIN01S_15800 [Vibrio inusitatus NBRC 102082]
METYKSHFVKELSTLQSYQDSDLLREVLQSIKRTIEAWELDRASFYLDSQLHIESCDFLSAERGNNMESAVDNHINASFKDYLSLVVRSEQYRIFSQSEMEISINSTLRTLEKEGVQWHIIMPIKVIDRHNAYLSVSRFNTEPFNDELIQYLDLIASVWLMMLEYSKKNIFKKNAHQNTSNIHLDVLTARQIEILRMISRGMSSKDISSELNLSVRTIESHRYRISSTLCLDKTDSLALFAHRNNRLINPLY